jgi:hypothetical protein
MGSANFRIVWEGDVPLLRDDLRVDIDPHAGSSYACSTKPGQEEITLPYKFNTASNTEGSSATVVVTLPRKACGVGERGVLARDKLFDLSSLPIAQLGSLLEFFGR